MPLGDAATVIAAWIAWEDSPGDERRAHTRVNAVRAYVGLADANEFHRHVAAARRAGRSISAAVYSWIPR